MTGVFSAISSAGFGVGCGLGVGLDTAGDGFAAGADFAASVVVFVFCSFGANRFTNDVAVASEFSRAAWASTSCAVTASAGFERTMLPGMSLR